MIVMIMAIAKIPGLTVKDFGVANLVLLRVLGRGDLVVTGKWRQLGFIGVRSSIRRGLVAFIVVGFGCKHGHDIFLDRGRLAIKARSLRCDLGELYSSQIYEILADGDVTILKFVNLGPDPLSPLLGLLDATVSC